MVKEAYEKRRVIWIGKNPKGDERFRIVDLGPVREGSRDNHFCIEQARGQDAMGINAWAGISTGAREAAIYALVETLGLTMVTIPASFGSTAVPHHPTEHPLFCELNMAAIEKREARGCDCGFPNDPDQR